MWWEDEITVFNGLPETPYIVKRQIKMGFDLSPKKDNNDTRS